MTGVARSRIGDARAAEMLKELSAYYGEPVLRLSSVCNAVQEWGLAIEAGARDRVTEAFGCRIQDAVTHDARKSNLLYRLLYCGEAVREYQCPVHQGRWSGCVPYPECHCQHGNNITGWLTDSPDSYQWTTCDLCGGTGCLRCRQAGKVADMAKVAPAAHVEGQP